MKFASQMLKNPVPLARAPFESFRVDAPSCVVAAKKLKMLKCYFCIFRTLDHEETVLETILLASAEEGFQWVTLVAGSLKSHEPVQDELWNGN